MVWQVVLTDRANAIQLVQSAICSPGTLSKSFVFLVSNSACRVRQIAAMRRSIVPTRSRWRRKSSNRSAASLVKSSIGIEQYVWRCLRS